METKNDDEDDGKKIQLPKRDVLEVLLMETDAREQLFISILLDCAGMNLTPKAAAEIILAAAGVRIDWLLKVEKKEIKTLVPGALISTFLLQDQEMIAKTCAHIFRGFMDYRMTTVRIPGRGEDDQKRGGLHS